MSAPAVVEQVLKPILEHPESQLSWTEAMFVIILPSALALYRGILKIRGAIPRSGKVKDIERAIVLAAPESLEWQMFKELQFEEVTFLITKLRLSKPMRKTVTGWMQDKAVTLEMIQKAWYHIDWSQETPGIRLSRFDWFYATYFSVSYFFLYFGSAWLLNKVTPAALQGQPLLLIYPAFGFLLSFFFLYQTRSFRAAKRLRRLVQGEPAFWTHLRTWF
jgi:hypothetical protein